MKGTRKQRTSRRWGSAKDLAPTLLIQTHVRQVASHVVRTVTPGDASDEAAAPQRPCAIRGAPPAQCGAAAPPVISASRKDHRARHDHGGAGFSLGEQASFLGAPLESPYERSSLKSCSLWTRSATPGLSLPGSSSLWVTLAMSVSEVTCMCTSRVQSVYHTNAITPYTRDGVHLPHVQLESRAIPVLVVDSVPSDLRGQLAH